MSIHISYKPYIISIKNIFNNYYKYYHSYNSKSPPPLL